MHCWVQGRNSMCWVGCRSCRGSMVVCSLHYGQLPGHGTLFFQLYPHFASTLLCTCTTAILCKVHIGLLALRIILAVTVAHIDPAIWFVVQSAKSIPIDLGMRLD